MKRQTIRFNDVEEYRLNRIKKLLNEDDDAKAIKFAIDWTLNNIENVTRLLVSPEWDVIFQRKRKTMQIDRKLY